MRKSKSIRYMMAVLTYYRSEWTDVSDDDSEFKLFVTKDLESLIRACMRRKTSVPNAAKEVEIFLDLQETRADYDIKSSAKPHLRPDASPDEPEGESDS